MFTLSNVSFSVDNKCLLHPVSTSFRQGEVTGLIGHNGSGKSTLLKLLARQYQPSIGDITFDQRPLGQWTSRQFAQQVAYLPQHLPVSEGLTGLELIRFGRYPWQGLFGRESADDQFQIERAIALTHTENLVHQAVDSLSGGERQRVWLAMLIAQQSRFLLLDEPLAALDIAHQVEVMALIQKLSHELGLGVVIVIHDINLAARYCDQLVALHTGSILKHGQPNQIMQPDVLRSIYGIGMHIFPHPEFESPVAVVA